MTFYIVSDSEKKQIYIGDKAELAINSMTNSTIPCFIHKFEVREDFDNFVANLSKEIDLNNNKVGFFDARILDNKPEANNETTKPTQSKKPLEDRHKDVDVLKNKLRNIYDDLLKAKQRYASIESACQNKENKEPEPYLDEMVQEVKNALAFTLLTGRYVKNLFEDNETAEEKKARVQENMKNVAEVLTIFLNQNDPECKTLSQLLTQISNKTRSANQEKINQLNKQLEDFLNSPNKSANEFLKTSYDIANQKITQAKTYIIDVFNVMPEAFEDLLKKKS